jgi:ribosomal protein S13
MYKQNVDTLAKIGHYKGLCLKLNLPVHGQRTHTNASTAFKLNHK